MVRRRSFEWIRSPGRAGQLDRAARRLFGLEEVEPDGVNSACPAATYSRPWVNGHLPRSVSFVADPSHALTFAGTSISIRPTSHGSRTPVNASASTKPNGV